MKNLLILMVVLLTAFAASAQTSLVATLSHEGNISTYYSANALKSAYAAAVDGDIITLSSGTFEATDIAKDLTIRGAGMDVDNNATILNGGFKIQNGTDEDENTRTTLEGVFVNGTVSFSEASDNTSFIKCRFKKVDTYRALGTSLNNLAFVNCIFDDLSLSKRGVVSVNLINCIVKNLSSCQPTSAMFTNCVVKLGLYTEYATFSNCIILSGTNASSGSQLYSSCMASNCYGGPYMNVFKEMYSGTNTLLDSMDIFEDEVSYKLKDEYAETLLGGDGTQAGVYGGAMPFDPVPSQPQITKFKVSPKTTADGRLSVEIEVKAN